MVYRNVSMDMNTNEIYKHFKTVEDCDRYAEQHGYTYRRCCGGMGICIPQNLIQKPHVKKTQDDCCCVCLEKTNAVTSCGHLVCAECMERVRPTCPYCRQTMIF